MLEDDTFSSQSTQDSEPQKKVTRSKKTQQNTKKNKSSDSAGLTKLDKSLFRTQGNSKGIIKPIKNKRSAYNNSADKKPLNRPKSVSNKGSGKELTKKLKALKKPNQNITFFTKTILQALFELNDQQK